MHVHCSLVNEMLHRLDMRIIRKEGQKLFSLHLIQYHKLLWGKVSIKASGIKIRFHVQLVEQKITNKSRHFKKTQHIL